MGNPGAEMTGISVWRISFVERRLYLNPDLKNFIRSSIEKEKEET